MHLQTLMPTYRLQWGTAGESQALAVAEGLGFDADIVAAAHRVAQQSGPSSRRGGHSLSPHPEMSQNLECPSGVDHRLAQLSCDYRAGSS